MTGYQEILTDPSYCGQLVTMTYPLIGNYGVNDDDFESRAPFVSGFIVKEASKIVSNYRATSSLQDFLKKYNIIGIEGVDTRAITKRIRTAGAMKAIVSTMDFDPASLKRKLDAAPSMEGLDLVKEVSVKEKYAWPPDQPTSRLADLSTFRVAVIDCGVKYNILRELSAIGAEVTVFPSTVNAEEILSGKFDGLMVSNGPGDPSAVTYVIETLKQLVGKLPIFGICLGHQMLGIALGGKTYKLKFGHRGANHPVKDLLTEKIEITSQNHGFCVDIASLPKDAVEVTHINLNDQTAEGLRHKQYPLFSVQYHPEASPGPHDAAYLFERFAELMKQASIPQPIIS
jgi:carbamoyl-phosphate synthase small subunit